MTHEIEGMNISFIPRNVEVAVTYLLNDSQLPDTVIKKRATNLAYEIWQNNSAVVSTDDGKLALANALAEIGQWIANKAEG